MHVCVCLGGRGDWCEDFIREKEIERVERIDLAQFRRDMVRLKQQITGCCTIIWLLSHNS